MTSPLENQLARALAKALIYECKKAGVEKHFRLRYIYPPWFQIAAWALVDYRVELDEANKIQVHY
jgi:hypothetical protein